MPFEERLVGYWARHGMEVSFLGVLRERKFVPTMMVYGAMTSLH